ncbi:filamentous hemagglutinin N-terminal domain-containing protein [Xylophilus sp. GOD-11R]|uniref:two-partner secretion domain-containing protein n=1 Tax=Xylophilus sp. GOD-11R TaxID=3089814 RepID=UPI00298C3CBB|nr:filamentous hemagglutinin N-terminal domain-containing protein [Xylophilus sp. GOD-11R]WPB57980.1 filamentous hemagglutinin N-terminal domain-containing protein [Xylophilus sp. GOD-11R]
MNQKRFRLIFSKRLGMLVPVAEDRAAQGKAAGDGAQSGAACPQAPPPHSLVFAPRNGLALRQFVVGLLSLWQLALTLAMPLRAYAGPTGASVAAGSATITREGLLTTITNSPNAIIDWASFSAAQQEVIRFIQQNAASSVLNRVTGQDPSQILGQLLSNGRVFLINPNGITFGAGSRVDTAGLVASTLGISNADFLAGRLQFDKTGAGASVQAAGLITVSPGGSVALLGDTVKNAGLIRADDGAVLLAAGRSVTLTDVSNPAIAVVVSAPENEVLNVGDILAASGQAALIGAAIGQQGRISVDSAGLGNAGDIVLKATNRIEVSAAARLSADGQGATSGGTILVGDRATGATSVAGSLSARGGDSGGHGGFIETSGRAIDLGGITVDAGSATGQGGKWLIDPVDIQIVHGPAGNSDYAPTGNSAITDGTIAQSLNTGTSVAITTSAGNAAGALGNITSVGNIEIIKSQGGSASFSLDADHDIILNGGQFILASQGAGNTLDVNLGAGHSVYVSAAGTHLPVEIATLGGNVFIGGRHGGETGKIYVVGDLFGTEPVATPITIDTRVDRSSTTSAAGSVQIKARSQAPLERVESVFWMRNTDIYADGIDIQIVGNSPAIGVSTRALHLSQSRLHNTGDRDVVLMGNYVYQGNGTNAGFYGALVSESLVEQFGNGQISVTGTVTGMPGFVLAADAYAVSLTQSSLVHHGQGDVSVSAIVPWDSKPGVETRPPLYATNSSVAVSHGNLHLLGVATATGSTMLDQVVLGNTAVSASGDINVTTRLIDTAGQDVAAGGFLLGTRFGSEVLAGNVTIQAGGNLNIAASEMLAANSGNVDIHAGNVNIRIDSTTSPHGVTVGGNNISKGNYVVGPTSLGNAVISDAFLQAAGNIAGNVVVNSAVPVTMNVGASGNATTVGNVQIRSLGDIAVARPVVGNGITLASGGNLTGNGAVTATGDVVLTGRGNVALTGDISGGGNVSVTGAGPVETAGVTGHGNVTVTGNGNVVSRGNIVNTGLGDTLAGMVVGNGDLVVSGLGNLRVGDVIGNGHVGITGNGTVTTGHVLNNGAGDLDIANEGTGDTVTGDVTGDVTGHGNVTIRGRGNLATGRVTGDGRVTVSGQGALSGGNILGNGDVEVRNAGHGRTEVGDVLGNGTVTIAGNGDVRIGGGNGSVINTGTGDTTLSGNGNVSAGTVTGGGNVFVLNAGGGDTQADAHSTGGAEVYVTPGSGFDRSVAGLLALTHEQIARLDPARVAELARSGILEGALQTLSGTSAAASALRANARVSLDELRRLQVRATGLPVAQAIALARPGLTQGEVKLHCRVDDPACKP